MFGIKKKTQSFRLCSCLNPQNTTVNRDLPETLCNSFYLPAKNVLSEVSNYIIKARVLKMEMKYDKCRILD